MSVPFYVSPEQQMKDRADFARHGIARGRSVAVMRYRDGICCVAENRSQTLHKVSEIYDRIGFAAVGRYNEFESLRVAGVRYADMRGFTYDRSDVTARSLANSYAQLLGAIFSSGVEKPYEVELVVCELGESATGDQIYRLTYDGSVIDEQLWCVMGGKADFAAAKIRAGFDAQAQLADAVRLAVQAISVDSEVVGEAVGSGLLSAEMLEIAVLDRTRVQARKFRRLASGEVEKMLAA